MRVYLLCLRRIYFQILCSFRRLLLLWFFFLTNSSRICFHFVKSCQKYHEFLTTRKKISTLSKLTAIQKLFFMYCSPDVLIFLFIRLILGVSTFSCMLFRVVSNFLIAIGHILRAVRSPNYTHISRSSFIHSTFSLSISFQVITFCHEHLLLIQFFNLLH